MNTVRVLLIASAAALVAACSSTPSKPAAPAAAPAPAAPAVANIAGVWTVTTESQMGAQDSKMTVTQTGKDIKGMMESPMGGVELTGNVDGNNVKWGFNFNAQGMDLRIDYTGTVDGNSMKGKAVFGTFGEGAFTAKKQ